MQRDNASSYSSLSNTQRTNPESHVYEWIGPQSSGQVSESQQNTNETNKWSTMRSDQSHNYGHNEFGT